MPTMSELSARVLSRLNLPSDALNRLGGNVERWLSYLAVEQPWLSDGENLRNQALFSDAAQAVADEIEDAERRVTAGPLPHHLLRLAWAWSDQQAQLFTFNYDLLLERALTALGRASTLGDIYAAPLSSRLAIGDHYMFSNSGPLLSVPRLYKLHGSVNWGFGGLTAPASDRATLIQDQPRWDQPAPDERSGYPRYRATFADLKPLIVPPTAAKSPYYGNSSLRAQWWEGAQTLKDSSELIVIGYSFPEADSTVRNWVATNLPSGALISLVDADEEIAARLTESLPKSLQIEGLRLGVSAVEQFTDDVIGPHVEWTLTSSGVADVPPDVSLRLNGVEQLRHLRDSAPWGADEQGALRWLHTRIEAHAPKLIDTSRVGRDQGQGWVREHRWAVLPLGASIGV